MECESANAYLELYHRAVRVQPSTELLMRQLALMHNALGVVLTDFFKTCCPAVVLEDIDSVSECESRIKQNIEPIVLPTPESSSRRILNQICLESDLE